MSEREPTNTQDKNLELDFQFHPPQQFLNLGDNTLVLDKKDSLEILGYRSIENPLPISKNMLSIDKDAFQPQDRQYQQKQSEHSEFRAQDESQDDLMKCLEMQGLHKQEQSQKKRDEKAPQNTKNVLRNFGNAQNHYILYHSRARKHISRNIRKSQAFDSWVRSLKLQNFENFKKVWSSNDSKLFVRVYKELCWEFYTEQAPSYVMSSRIRKRETQLSHLRHIYRFLEGLLNPSSFNYFKSVEKISKN